MRTHNLCRKITLKTFFLLICMTWGLTHHAPAAYAHSQGFATTGPIYVKESDCNKILNSIARIIKRSSGARGILEGNWMVMIYEVSTEDIDVHGFCPGRGVLFFHVTYGSSKWKKKAHQIRAAIADIMNLSKGKIIRRESVCDSNNPKFKYLCN